MTEHSNFNQAVANLQRYLRQLSLAENAFSPPPIDGVLDDATLLALREYQKNAGLAETGIADAETWERLYADYRSSLAVYDQPRAILLFPPQPQGFFFDKDSRGFAVAAIQFMLRELSRDFGDRLAIAVDGFYGEETFFAVKSFQERFGVVPSGLTDRLTWDLLADRHNALLARSLRE